MCFKLSTVNNFVCSGQEHILLKNGDIQTFCSLTLYKCKRQELVLSEAL